MVLLKHSLNVGSLDLSGAVWGELLFLILPPEPEEVI